MNKTGDRIGNYTLIESVGSSPTSKDTTNYWSMKCDCGNVVRRIPSSLRRNQTNSCPACRSGSKSRYWTGHEEISGKLFSTIKNNASVRNLEFEVSIEYVWSLFVLQRRKCALTGRDLQFGKNRTASLDRINSSLGYVEGNLQWVSVQVNMAKKNMSEADFVRLCGEVSTHAQTKAAARAINQQDPNLP